MDDTTQELIDHLNGIIARETAAAYADCKRYREEEDQRCEDRLRQMHIILRAPRAQLDQIYKLLAKIETLKNPMQEIKV